ncbi:MAG: serine/threonine protein kinase [Proteobacteria bacterium]|nr:serine/threonine protein kinase [Pseudomonadota bacterium]
MEAGGAAAGADRPVRGDRHGRYEIIDRLATGGMGEVYLARVVGAAGFQKLVVIKKILPHLAEQATFVEGLVKEAKLLTELTHPNIVQVLDLGRDGRDYFMAMEYVPGYNLATIAHYCAQKRMVIPASVCTYIGLQVLAALEYAHGMVDAEGNRRNVIHRDVSPQNVLVDRGGPVKLTDFGIAKIVSEAEGELTTTLKGKFRYMAPEAIDGGRVDQRYDLFAVGIILFEALCRRHLFGGRSDVEILAQVRAAKVPSIDRYHPAIPRLLQEVIERSLRRDPAARFQSAGEFASALREALWPQAEGEAAKELRAFITALYDQPDFPLSRPKLPVAPKLDAPLVATRSIVLRSDVVAAAEGTPERGARRRERSRSAREGLLWAAVLAITLVLGFLVSAQLRRPLAPVSLPAGSAGALGGPGAAGRLRGPREGAGADAGRPASASTSTAAAAAGRDGSSGREHDPGPGRSQRQPVARREVPFTQAMGSRALARQGGAITACFRTHMPAGRAEVTLRVISTVLGDGRVAAVTIEPPEEASSPIGRCVSGLARRVRYPSHDRPQVTFVQPLTVRRAAAR